MRVIGFDYGRKKIGVAVGQSITQTAQPLDVLLNDKSLMIEIDKIVEDWTPDCFVVGEPLLADGSEHPLEKAIENFIKVLDSRYNLRIFRENEALTSFEAAQYRRSSGKQEATDAHAAAILLESWFRHNG